MLIPESHLNHYTDTGLIRISHCPFTVSHNPYYKILIENKVTLNILRFECLKHCYIIPMQNILLTAPGGRGRMRIYKKVEMLVENFEIDLTPMEDLSGCVYFLPLKETNKMSLTKKIAAFLRVQS